MPTIRVNRMLTALWFALATQAAAAPLPASLAPFTTLPLPSCAGLPLVEWNTGAYSRAGTPERIEFRYVVGWLLRQDATHLVLWHGDLTTSTHPRRVAFPEDWARLRADHPRGRPLPGELRELEFSAWCRAAHEADPTDEWSLRRSALSASTLAWWAHQRGDLEIRNALLETADARFRAAGPVPVLEQLRRELAANARWRVLTAANDGHARVELLAAWQGIAQLAPEAREGEARSMVAAYESLLADDAAFVDPEDATLLALPASAQVEVWLQRLRDLAAYQCWQPGSCDVFVSLRGSATRAADALRDLSWAAVPGLIGRLDDARPTRSLGFWRNFAPETYHLLTHGACCAQILRATTGEWFASRAAGERWWKAHGERGANGFFLGQLACGENVRFAAEQLLCRDAETHLPAVAAALAAAGPAQRAELAPAFAPYAQPAHVALLESLLPLPDVWAEIAVTKALGRLGAAARGVDRLTVRIEAAVTARPDETLSWLDAAVEVVATQDLTRGERLVRALLDAPTPQVKLAAFRVVSHAPTPRVLATLGELLADRTPTGSSSYFPIRVCDAAADALSAVLDVSEEYRLEGSPLQRDATIAALKAHHAKKR